MIVKTFYDNGHFDVFDTAALVDTKVFPGNVVTDFSLEFSDIESHKALWLAVYIHECSKEYRGTVNCHGLPVARRRDACSVLIADKEDMKHLQKVLVDDKVFLLREGDEFIDGFRLNAMVERTRSINAAVVETADYLLAAGTPDLGQRLEKNKKYDEEEDEDSF